MNHEHLVQAAVHLLKDGYMCSESIVMAFAEIMGIERDTAAKISCAFAGGMSQGRTCGAVSGAVMVIGLAYGSGLVRDPYAKDRCFQLTQEFSARFKHIRHTLECHDILRMNHIDPENPNEMRTLREKTLCADIVKESMTLLLGIMNEEGWHEI